MRTRISIAAAILAVILGMPAIAGAQQFKLKAVAMPAPAGGHTVLLSWTPSADGAANPTLAYNVYRASSSGAETSPALNTTPIAANCTSAATCTFTDTAPPLGKSFYVVRAVFGGLESVNSNETTVSLPPAAPVQQPPVQT